MLTHCANSSSSYSNDRYQKMARPASHLMTQVQYSFSTSLLPSSVILIMLFYSNFYGPSLPFWLFLTFPMGVLLYRAVYSWCYKPRKIIWGRPKKSGKSETCLTWVAVCGQNVCWCFFVVRVRKGQEPNYSFPHE